jgi:hypothetical protein
MLAQTRPGAKGALLLHGSIPFDEFGGGWPDGLPLQIHTMEDDDWGDVDIARELAATIEGAQFFLYPVTRTWSPTTACAPSTRPPPRWSGSACSASSPARVAARRQSSEGKRVASPNRVGRSKGRHSWRGWASRSATIQSTAGSWPIPRWLLRTATFSLRGPGSWRQARQSTTPSHVE